MRKFVALFSVMALAIFAADKYRVDVSLMEHPDGYYKLGEEITCKARVLKNGQPLKGEKVKCQMKFEGKIQKEEVFECDGEYHFFKQTAPRAGWNHFGFQILDANGKPRRGEGITRFGAKPFTMDGEIGAMTNPDDIITKVPFPEDFDAFWAKTIADLKALPLKVDYERLEVGGNDNGKIELYSVTVNCLTDTSSGPKAFPTNPVTGYLAIPVVPQGQKLPAMVEYLSWSSCDASKNTALARARQGKLSFYASWHGLPTGQLPQFYQSHCGGKYFGSRRNITNREKWDFRFTFLRVLRALQFIKSRPEWNQKDLVVMGGSLGGAETACAAAFDKDVTLAIVSVPCFCEYDAPLAGRWRSLPYGGVNDQGPQPEAAMKALAYYDVVNFGKKITCEVCVCTGFADELCPPSNVFAFYNNIPKTTKKMMTTDPRTGHYGTTKNVKGDKRLEEYFKSITVQKYTAK